MILFDYDDASLELSISGDTDLLKNNRSFWFFLNSEFTLIHKDDGNIRILLAPEELVKAFQEIDDYIQELGLQTQLDEGASKSLKRIKSEQEDFFKRSKKAKKIYWGNIDSDELLDFTSHLKASFKSGRILDEKQTLAAFHLAFSKNACNFSVPGAGKTSMILGSFSYLKSKGIVDTILVVGPLACFAPWENEWKLCFNKKPNSLRFDRSLSSVKKNTFLKTKCREDLILMHYSSLKNNLEEIIEFLQINEKVMIVIDEAHWIKRVEGGVWAEAALRISPFGASRVILTGTPAPQGFEDLHNLFEFIWPNKDLLPYGINGLRDLSDTNSNLDIGTRESRIKSLVDSLKPYFVRISKKDLNLPKPTNHPVELVEMGEIQKEIYNYIEDKYVERANQMFANKDPIDKLLKAKTIRLRQAATNPSLLKNAIEMDGETYEENVYEDIDEPEIFNKIRDYDEMETPNKFLKTLELTKQIVQRGEKVIIWVNFVRNIHKLSSLLENSGFKNKVIYGDIPLSNSETDFSEDNITRETIIKEFHKKNSSFSVIIANAATAGESISLHLTCNNAIYVERDYNAASFLQSKDRIHRKGIPEDRITNYYFLESSNSVDQAISSRLEFKIKNLEEIIEHEIPLFSITEDLNKEDIKSILENYATRQY
tara:strand:- start:1168 stop:3132 length:1965 start_codon:yes stop_codon:yes gene_type:complete